MTVRVAVWRMAASVSVATGAYGISFGALAVAAGLDVWQTMALSLLMFSGGSQFAFLGALGAGGPAAAGAARGVDAVSRPFSTVTERTSPCLNPSSWRRAAGRTTRPRSPT